MDKQFNRYYLFSITIVSAMGGLLFGYDWVVIGGAKPFYELFFGISDQPFWQGLVMSIALVGCLVGALLTGMFSDKYGRKKLLIIAAVLFVWSAIGTGAVSNIWWLMFYRLIGGFAIGIASNLSPMYIAEVSPANMRGRLVSINQLTIVLGILLAQIANWLIAQPVPENSTPSDILASWNGQWGWRYMFWAENVPAVLFLVMAFFIPESPRWLMSKNMDAKAEHILEKIGGREYAEKECGDIRNTINDVPEGEPFKTVFGKKFRKVLFLGVFLAVFQQWCGINVIFNYAQEIFSAAGYSVSDILMNIVVTGITNVLFTFVAMYTVDRWGRRHLLLFGSAGLALIYLLMGGAYYFGFSGLPLLIIVVAAIACYAMSLAPVMWVVVSEIFPTRVRGAAMSIATFALWAACFLLTYSFPVLNSAFGPAAIFWLYGVICVVGYVVIRKYLPETKGKSLEELERKLIK